MKVRSITYGIILLFVIAGCAVKRDRLEPVIRNGFLDLSAWNFTSDSPMMLRGAWEFYWGSFVYPEDFKRNTTIRPSCFVDAPGVWNNYSCPKKEPGAFGYSTYRVKIQLPSKVPTLAFKVGEINSSYRIFVNGALISQGGKPGTSHASSAPGRGPDVVIFNPDSPELDIIIHVSNFHYFKGGLQYPIELGTEKEILIHKEKKQIIDIALIGVLVIMALYHFGIFLFRKSEYMLLIFSIFCVLMAIYHMSIGDLYFNQFFQGALWEMMYKFTFIPIYAGTAVILAFIRSLFPSDVPRAPYRVMLIVSGIFTLMVLIFPARIYSFALPVCHGVMGVGIGFIVYVLIMAVRRHREGSLIFMVGIAGFFATVINDILLYEKLISTTDLAPFGVLFLIFSQTVLLARMLSKTTRSLEEHEKTVLDLQKRLSLSDEEVGEYVITPATEEKIKKAIEYIRIHYRSNISREGLAAAHNMHPDNFGRIFKMHTGKKIGDLINELRVGDASRELTATDSTVLDIALKVGYENLRTFNRAFKKILKITPMEFRRKNGTQTLSSE